MANDDILISISEEPDAILHVLDSYVGSAYSPQVSIDDIEGGHRLTVTYDDAEQGITSKSFDVLDGETGAQGPKGDDGYSPTVTITDTAYGHRVTITDASGEHSYTVPTYVNEEQARADAEQDRQSAETARNSAEQARTQAESQRAENEAQRAAAESSREFKWAVLEHDISDAVEGAETVNATVSKTGGTATITVTDREGTAHIATVTDGAVGPAGADGTSPTARVERVTGGAEVTVTDASGTTTAMLYDATIEAGSVTDAMLAPDGIKAQVKSMWGNRLTGELTGEVLTASDAYTAYPLEVGVQGASEQASYTGKNLFDKDKTPRGYYNANTGAFAANNNYVWWSVPVSEGDVVRWLNSWDCTASYWSGGELAGKAAQTGGGNYTVPAGIDEVRGYCNSSGWSTCIVTKNNADMTYEPYVGGKPSPSPDYPQEIRSVVNPVVTLAGKNLLPNNRFCKAYYNQAAGNTFDSATSGSGVVTDNGDGTFTMTATSGWDGLSFYSDVIPAGDYRLKLAFAGATPRVSISLVDADTMKFVGTPVNYTTSDTYDRTITIPAPRIIVVSVASSSAGTVTITKPQLEAGSTATEYEPYQGTTVTLPVTLRSLPDGTKDTATYTYLRPSTREGWAVYSGEVTRRVIEATALDQLNWQRNSSNGIFYVESTIYLPDYLRITNTPSCATFAQYTGTVNGTQQQSAKDDNTYGLLGTGYSQRGIYVKATAYTDVASFVQTLVGQSLCCALATHTTETLDPIELPSVIGPSCTIWATADATPTLNVEYERDVTIAYNALLEAIADIATS